MKKHEFEAIVNAVYIGWECNNFSTLAEPKTPMWEMPSIGIASGDDPYFDFLKDHIGKFHWSPLELFNLKYGNSIVPVKSKDLRVVSLMFPQVKETKSAQRKEKKYPSEKWIVTRGEWEPGIKVFSTRIIEILEKNRIRAVSLDLQKEFSRHQSETLGMASSFSHRHAAHAAGLGTFGLSDGLITKRGKAARFTTYVVEAPLDVTEKSYSKHNEWCLFFKNGSCGLCIKRCPVNAITKDGHNKGICSNYEDIVLKEGLPYDVDTSNYIFGCGLCQVGIPCQDKSPV